MTKERLGIDLEKNIGAKDMEVQISQNQFGERFS